MPLGTSTFGTGFFGTDPPTPYVAAPRTVFRAKYFDPSVRQWVVLDSGKLQDIHPVDAKVAFLAGIERGTMPIAPLVGNTFRLRLANVYGAEARLVAANYAVVETYGDMIRANDIKIVRVTVDEPRPNIVSVYYANLRLPPGVKNLGGVSSA